MTNFIELNRLYTTQLTVVNLQLVTSATCFGLVGPSSGLQRLVSIKVHNVALPMGSHDLYCLYVCLKIYPSKRGRGGFFLVGCGYIGPGCTRVPEGDRS